MGYVQLCVISPEYSVSKHSGFYQNYQNKMPIGKIRDFCIILTILEKKTNMHFLNWDVLLTHFPLQQNFTMLSRQYCTKFAYLEQNLDFTHIKQLKYIIAYIYEQILNTCVTMIQHMTGSADKNGYFLKTKTYHKYTKITSKCFITP